ncbi:glycosyltransferase family 4 protein [Neobacillus kokaensis]|uniref:Glycosyl transferase family 1 domain-containing protein n=1 Tax=Neobacillus kokaensis TaxID=2759023 RepID=A0ABQ3N4W6_9BACI|nr:glycosyltransferase family 4 protein [Neobacillus kokaensis]GHH98662.1 hypothetical protein AM1BK_22050 [Neobacillus kokaensis]
MKVLYLTNIPSPYRVDFFNELGKLCDLTVLFERNNAQGRNEQWFEKKCQNYKAIFLKSKELQSDGALSFEILKYLKKTYDIIVIGGYSTPTSMLAINYLKVKKKSFLLNADGGFINPTENKLKRAIKKYFISSATFWLSTGKETSEYLKYYGADENRIFKYPFSSIIMDNIVESPISINEKQRLKKELGVSAEKVVLTVSQFIYRKGIDVLINAWGKINYHNKSELIIVGGGELKNQYQQMVEEKKCLNIRIIDFQVQNELLKYYKISDFMVLPTREDIWGLVINEAFANALPVITTDKCIAGLELIEDSQNGFIVPTNNVSILVDKINLLLSNDSLLLNISKNNLEKIRPYTIENMAYKHIDIFKEIRSNF